MPVILCLLCLIPGLKAIFEWAEEKNLDLFFNLDSTYQNHNSNPSPVLILTKDQAFYDRFARGPNRNDFAELLKTLSHQNVSVAALDFIFDEPKAKDKDQNLNQSLASFPIPILAQHFVTRNQKGYSQFSNSDLTRRPPWPNKLYKPFYNSAATTGLINIFSDYDGAVRYTPLAFLPEEKTNYIPSLGFATWIGHEVSANFRHALITQASFPSLKLWLTDLLNKAPYQRKTLGHKGLDRLVFELELKFLYRFISRHQPDLAPLNIETQQNLLKVFNISKFKQSWVKFPEKPLPLIGPDFAPCLRIPFQKSHTSQTKDKIESKTMSLFLKTKAEKEASDHFISNNILNLKAANTNLSPQAFTIAKNPKSFGSLNGKISTISGKPASATKVLIFSEDSGNWKITQTNTSGEFNFENIAPGNYSLELIRRFKYCTISSKLNNKIKISPDKNSKLSLLSMPEPTIETSVKSTAKNANELILFGEPLNILKTDNEGKLPIEQIPPGIELAALNEEIEDISLSGSNTIVLETKAPLKNENIALLDSDDNWKHSFVVRVMLEQLAKPQFKLSLPAALDVQAQYEGNGQSPNDSPAELAIIPGTKSLDATKFPILANKNKNIKAQINATDFSPTAEFIFINEEQQLFVKTASQSPSLSSGNYRVFYKDQNSYGIYNKRKAQLLGRPVFIGTSLAEDQDFVITPINFMERNNPRLPGINLHANLCASLIEKRFLTPVFFHFDYCNKLWPLVITVLIIPVLLLQNLLFIKRGAMVGGLLSLIISIFWFIFSLACFHQGMLLPVVFPIAQILSYSMSMVFILWSISRQQEKETRSTFGRFISPAMVNEILENPKTLAPGGEKKELTVIFTDLAGFTTISEKLPPEQLTELMNEYLDEMTNILFKHKGTLDKYIGDAIMGFWNHPNELSGHPQFAVECAIEMQERLMVLQKHWEAKGLPEVSMRAGINTATCMVGFIGSKTQMNFTCLGDGVNLAARLEGANKPYGTLMMISEGVNSAIDTKKIRTRFLDFLAVKGKTEPIKVYELIGYTQNDQKLWEKVMPKYNKAHNLYLERKWQEAEKLFKEILKIKPQDGPSLTYIDRCQHFATNPPPEIWDGRFILKSK